MKSGDFFKLLREVRGWNQTKLSEESGVDASQISRLEKGRVEAPSDDVITKLCKAFNISKDDYFSAIGLNSASKKEEIRVGFGHTIWSAPLIKLIMEDGGAQGVLLASFAERESPEDSVFKPYFYSQEEYLSKGLVQIPRDFEGKAGEDGQTTTIKYFSADTLLNLINADRLDCIVVPGAVYDDYWLSLERAAQIMYTSKGNTVVQVARHPSVEFPGTLDEHNLIAFLKEYNDGPVEIVYPRRTIAEKYLSQYFLALLHPVVSSKVIKNAIDVSDLSKVEEVIGGIIERSTDEKKPRVVIFLAWEPHVSWVEQMIGKRSENTWQVVTLDSYDLNIANNKEIIYLSMDVLFKKEKIPFLLENKKEIIKNFFHSLHAAIRRLSALEDYDVEAEMIADYLDMEKGKANEALKAIHFRLMYYPEWVQLISSK